jgi:hypothetical protein
MSNKPTYYRADYYYSKNGSRSRTQISGLVSQHLNGATTESAVLNYLRHKHSGYEIELMSLDWS